MKWKYCVKRQTTVFPAFGVTESFGRISKNLEIPFDYKNIRFVHGEWWYPEDEYNTLKNVLKEKVENDIAYFFRIGEKQRMEGRDLKKMVHDPKDLKTYIEKMHNFYAFWWIAIPASEILEEKVRVLLKNKKIDAIFEDLIFTTRSLSLTREREELMQPDVDLQKHAKKYEWISTSYHLGEPLTVNDFQKLRDEVEPEKVLHEIQREKQRKEEMLKKLSELVSEEELKLVQAMQDVIFLRNYQKETVNECQFRSETFLKSIADALKISWEDFLSLTPYEVLNNQVPHNRDEWAIILENGKTFITDNIGRYELPEQRADLSDKDLIIGSVACKGKVSGKVRIVLEKEDLFDFEKGEILVTTMTSIDFVHVMKQAGAIITDEGGITCHAAIFSREIGVPCIIGTTNATKLLKTGEVVEVDANTGIVKKI